MATAKNNLSHYDKSKVPNAQNLKFGLVVSEWNGTITENLYRGAVDTLLDCGAKKEHILRWNVPGSFELIYACKKLLETNSSLDAVIAIGCIIRGETKHFNFVCEGVTQGIKDLNLMFNVPTIFCVLTDNTMQQSIDRSGGKHGNKGVEAAIAAIKMANLGQ